VQNSTQIVSTNKTKLHFLQTRCPSCRPTNSIRVLEGKSNALKNLWPRNLFFLFSQ